MKTLADFKRRLQVGTKLHTTYHCKMIGRDEKQIPIFGDEDKGIREVSIVKSTLFALKTQQGDKAVDSYCAYPKATEAKIVDENTITIFEKDSRTGKDNDALIPVLTYKFVE